MPNKPGSETRKRQNLIGVRLNDNEYNDVLDLADDLKMTAPNVVRSAIAAFRANHQPRQYR